MAKTLEFAADVPIIGQQLEAHAGYVMATATCKCRPNNKPFLIQGVNSAEVCLHCRTAYAIVALQFDRTRGMTAPVVTIAPVGISPAAAPPAG